MEEKAHQLLNSREVLTVIVKIVLFGLMVIILDFSYPLSSFP